MYIPRHFLVDDRSSLFEFIESNTFGIIFSTHDNVPVASHLPFLLDRELGCLIGHFARPNEQWKEIQGQEALIVFSGPHTYISSSWYETNMSVPTWNYVAVHVYGNIELIEDQTEVLQTLKTLVTKYETVDSKYEINETNKEFIEGLVRGIVPFKLNISRMEGKWKLSQNHSEERQRNVIEQLEQSESEDAQKIAELMSNNLRN
ncbi:FMN-binding negative transcriptional regulator [Paenibacillus sp. SC116]|uniref:FMN-binding negative transcriptional regulator n=1 Tax=Paenibacillus sp. SC116 TaxID=2968986 RepID=UPI00215B0876|nr:FMN-binding negative transcriptional regulator [Paenibacillus sp. SC116]MCR8845650.1 FMN-binding negative transcriptional regulator [Paenibacillus sp. SC116]